MTASDKELQALLALSERMALAAENEAWDELEATCEAYFVEFGKRASTLASPAATSMLQALAVNQQRVMDAAQPWMTATKSLLDAWSESARSGSPHSTPPE